MNSATTVLQHFVSLRHPPPPPSFIHSFIHPERSKKWFCTLLCLHTEGRIEMESKVSSLNIHNSNYLNRFTNTFRGKGEGSELLRTGKGHRMKTLESNYDDILRLACRCNVCSTTDFPPALDTTGWLELLRSIVSCANLLGSLSHSLNIPVWFWMEYQGMDLIISSNNYCLFVWAEPIGNYDPKWRRWKWIHAMGSNY